MTELRLTAQYSHVFPLIQPQDIDVLCVQPNEIAQNAVEPIFLASKPTN